MLINILLFLFFAFLGWIIDTTYCSIAHRQFTSSGYYKGIPICPIYGFGGLLMLTSFIQFENLYPIYTILITAIMFILLEYIVGWFCEHVLNEKLWDYSNIKGNINGYINPIHSLYWLLITTVLYFLINPQLGTVTLFMNNLQELFNPYDTYITIIFLVFAYSLTIRTRDKRLKIYKTKQKEILEKIDNLKKRLIL
jgi:uncharacterized membrane protein